MSVQNTVNYIPPTKIQNDPIWINDFSILLKKEKLTEFFPTKFQTNEERLNAIVRISLYASILLSINYSDMKYISVFIFALFLTYIIYTSHPKSPANSNTKIEKMTNIKMDLEQVNEYNSGSWNKYKNSNWTDNTTPYVKQECTKPTLDNPFMNVTMKNYLNIDEDKNIVDLPPACNPDDPVIKKQIDENFNNNLYNDVSDMFGKVNSQRNFYTMPWTTIPNDPNLDFAKWLYASPQSCKEDQNACIRGIHEDIRQNRFVFPEPNVNPVTSKKLE